VIEWDGFSGRTTVEFLEFGIKLSLVADKNPDAHKHHDGEVTW
jgi:hypothetical protein